VRYRRYRSVMCRLSVEESELVCFSKMLLRTHLSIVSIGLGYFIFKRTLSVELALAGSLCRYCTTRYNNSSTYVVQPGAICTSEATWSYLILPFEYIHHDV